MSDVDFHDETVNQPGTVSVDVGGHVFTALADASISCTVERVFATIDAACRKAGGPISFTKRELVKPVGVGVKAIGNALERLGVDNRVTTERRGQRYWYQTVWERYITEQGQLGLVNVAAITSRPAPVTRLDQLGSTVHAGSTHPEGIGVEPSENPEGTGREPGGNREGTGTDRGRYGLKSGCDIAWEGAPPSGILVVRPPDAGDPRCAFPANAIRCKKRLNRIYLTSPSHN